MYTCAYTLSITESQILIGIFSYTYIWTCIYVYTYTHAQIYMCIYIYTYKYIHIWICIYIWSCIHISLSHSHYLSHTSRFSAGIKPETSTFYFPHTHTCTHIHFLSNPHIEAEERPTAYQMLTALEVAEHDDEFQPKSKFANGCLPIISFASFGKRVERSLTVCAGEISSPFPLQRRAGGGPVAQRFSSQHTSHIFGTLPRSSSFYFFWRFQCLELRVCVYVCLRVCVTVYLCMSLCEFVCVSLPLSLPLCLV